MEKPICNDSQFFERTSSSPTDLDMNWPPTTLSQSEPSIQSRPPPSSSSNNQYINRLATTAYNSSSYKVSIGHETVNITEIARHQPSTDLTSTKIVNERRRFITKQKDVTTLSLCFMCFISASLILIGVSIMNLLFRTTTPYNNDMIPLFAQSKNFTPGYVYIFATPNSPIDSISNHIIPIYDHIIRDIATVVCLLIIVLNCFCLLVFSIEIYLSSNRIKTKENSSRCLCSSSTSRFIAICCFYASIPALILVMCLFILLNMSLIPAIISLLVLGLGLIFILVTLLTYFATWQNQNISIMDGKLTTTVNNTSIYPTAGTALLDADDDVDLAKIDELSTLV